MPQQGKIEPHGRSGRCWAGPILLAVLGLLFWTLPAAGHPPKEMSIAYDLINQILTVQITHTVSSPGQHFITKVNVVRDGLKLASFDYSRQPEQATFVYHYPVEAVVGTVLEVTVTCNLIGSRTEKLTVVKKPIRVSSLHP